METRRKTFRLRNKKEKVESFRCWKKKKNTKTRTEEVFVEQRNKDGKIWNIITVFKNEIEREREKMREKEWQQQKM